MGTKGLYQNIKMGLFTLLLLTGGGVAFAADTDMTLENFLSIIYDMMLPAAVILGFFLIALSGYKIMTSQGNPVQTKAGKENLTSAIFGLIFVLLSVVILRIIIGSFIQAPGF